jgi:archaellum biogenesis ATPase FlaH
MLMNQNRSVEERVGHRDSQSPATDKGSDFEIDYLLQSARKLVDNNEFVLATNIYRKVVAMDLLLKL